MQAWKERARFAVLAGVVLAAAAGPHCCVPFARAQGPGIAPPGDPNASGFSKAGAAIDRSLSRMRTAIAPKPTTESTEVPSPWIESEKARDPGPELFVSLAEVYFHQGNMPTAEAQYQKALNKDPKYLPAQIGLARVYDRMGQPDRAQQMYRQVIEASPRDAALRNDLAISYLKSGQVAEAVKELEQAIAIDPQSKLYRNNIARPLVGLDRNGDAYAHLSAVYEPAIAYYNLGFLLNEKGDRAAALMHFRRAAEVKPDFAEARQWCTALEAQFAPRSPGMGFEPLLARQQQSHGPSTHMQAPPPQQQQQQQQRTAPVVPPASQQPLPTDAPVFRAPMAPPAVKLESTAAPPPSFAPRSEQPSVASQAPAVVAPQSQPLPEVASNAPLFGDMAEQVSEAELAPHRELAPHSEAPPVNALVTQEPIDAEASARELVALPSIASEHSPPPNDVDSRNYPVIDATPASSRRTEIARREPADSSPVRRGIAGVHHFPTSFEAQRAQSTQKPSANLVAAEPALPTHVSSVDDSEVSYWQAQDAQLMDDDSLSMLEPMSDLDMLAGHPSQQDTTTEMPAASSKIAATRETGSGVTSVDDHDRTPTGAAARWVMPTPQNSLTIRETPRDQAGETQPTQVPAPAPSKPTEQSNWRAYRAPSRY